MADPIDIILKLVVKHENLINILAQATTEHAQLIEQGQVRCCRENCTRVATVRHLSLGLRCCDHCAAALIVKAKRSLASDSDVNMNLLRGIVMLEEAWVDVPGAIGLRHAQDIVTMANRGIEPEVPEDPLQWH